ncbi:hypothetical protein GC194_14495 [bacterium]|nr:hypothetical protein [bacterium]
MKYTVTILLILLAGIQSAYAQKNAFGFSYRMIASETRSANTYSLLYQRVPQKLKAFYVRPLLAAHFSNIAYGESNGDMGTYTSVAVTTGFNFGFYSKYVGINLSNQVGFDLNYHI